jgi:hypothetical protein
MKYIPTIGQRFSHYEVISEEIKVNGSGRMFNVKCDCGKTEFKTAKHLSSGRCKSCKSCASKRTAIECPPPTNWANIGDLGRVYFTSLKHGALRRGFVFEITQEYCWNLFLKQNKKCALSGYNITLSKNIKNQRVDYKAFTASLDRIDSSVGYIEGNVQWVHRDINWMKNNFNQTDFIEICIAVADYQRQADQQPSSENDIKVSEKVQRLGGEESTNKLPKSVRQLKCNCEKDSNGTRRCPTHG